MTTRSVPLGTAALLVGDAFQTTTRTPVGPTDFAPGELSAGGLDFFDMARVLFPWLPDVLVQVYADAWAATDSQGVAFATVVADPQFDNFFPGLKRPDGTLRMSPAEYASTFEGYSTVLREAGLNPAVFVDQLAGLFEGDVSVAEFGQRVSTIQTQVLDNIEGVRNFYAAEFGLTDLTDEALVAAALDPTGLGDDILNRRINIAQVGGQAAAAGFTIGRDFAQRLVSQGLSQAGARQVFGLAGTQLPGLQRSAARFGGDDLTLELSEFTDALVGLDATQRRRISQFQAQESSLFTRSGLRRDRAGLIGLQER